MSQTLLPIIVALAPDVRCLRALAPRLAGNLDDLPGVAVVVNDPGVGLVTQLHDTPVISGRALHGRCGMTASFAHEVHDERTVKLAPLTVRMWMATDVRKKLK